MEKAVFNPMEVVKKVCNSCAAIFPSGIHDAYLYGSYARGDFSAESDVDILLTVNGEDLGNYHWKLAEIESDLSLEYDRLISVVVVPFGRFQQYAASLPFYRNVLREGIRHAG